MTGDTGPDPDPAALAPDETVLAALHVTYSNHAMGHVDALRAVPSRTGSELPSFGRMFGSSARRRRVTGIGRYLQWQESARAAGFPVAGMAMHLQVTERRMRVFSASFVRGRPRRYAGSLPLRHVAQITVRRALFGTQLILLLHDGQMVSVEANSHRKARDFADSLTSARDGRSRPSV